MAEILVRELWPDASHLVGCRRSLESRITVNPFQTHSLKRSPGSRPSRRGQTGRRYPATSSPPRQTRCRRRARTEDRLRCPPLTRQVSRGRTSAPRSPRRSTKSAACPSAWTPPWWDGRAASPAFRAAPVEPCRSSPPPGGAAQTPRRSSATTTRTSRSFLQRCCC